MRQCSPFQLKGLLKETILLALNEEKNHIEENSVSITHRTLMCNLCVLIFEELCVVNIQ